MEWSDWSACSVTCGTGIHTRIRTCENGCSSVTVFELTDTQACDFGPCAPIFTEWSDWSTCSVICGTGIHTRTRTCGDHCSSVTSSDLADEQACNEGGPCGSPCIDYRTDTHCSGALILRTTFSPSPNGPSYTAYEAVGGYNRCASLCIGIPGCVSFNWVLNSSESGICELYSSGWFSSKVAIRTYNDNIISPYIFTSLISIEGFLKTISDHMQ